MSQQAPPPPPGAYPPARPPKKRRRWPWIVVAVLVLIVAIVAIAGSGKNKKASTKPTTTVATATTAVATSPPSPAPPTTGTPDSTAPPTTKKATGSIGKTAHTGDFDVTLDTVQDPYTSTNQFDSIPAGQRFVAVEVTVKNTASDQKPISSLISFELTDSKSRPWKATFSGSDLPKIDGEVAAHDSRRGWVFFGVGTDATGLKLRVKGDFTSTGTVFTL